MLNINFKSLMQPEQISGRRDPSGPSRSRRPTPMENSHEFSLKMLWRSLKNLECMDGLSMKNCENGRALHVECKLRSYNCNVGICIAAPQKRYIEKFPGCYTWYLLKMGRFPTFLSFGGLPLFCQMAQNGKHTWHRPKLDVSPCLTANQWYVTGFITSSLCVSRGSKLTTGNWIPTKYSETYKGCVSTVVPNSFHSFELCCEK